MPLKEFIIYISQEKGTCPHHMGPQGEAPGLVRRQKQQRENVAQTSTVFSRKMSTMVAINLAL